MTKLRFCLALEVLSVCIAEDIADVCKCALQGRWAKFVQGTAALASRRLRLSKFCSCGCSRTTNLVLCRCPWTILIRLFLVNLCRPARNARGVVFLYLSIHGYIVWQWYIPACPESTNVRAVLVLDTEDGPHASPEDLTERDTERGDSRVL